MSKAATVTMIETQAEGFFLAPFNRLHLSEKNVRKAKPNKEALAELAANIAQKGIRQNLIVEPSEQTEGHFAVLAGGRRWRAVEALVKAGTLDADYPVPCRLRADDDIAAEASMAENYFRESMHPADEYEAFAAMVDQGMDEDAIALHFGCDVKRVRQRMKLAQVHPTILKAFRRGDLTERDVMAFTLADTKKAQLAVFKELDNGQRCSPHAIKRAITQDGERSDSPLARFVGLKAYEKAGGRLYADMFEGVEYLPDRAVLTSLADKKLMRVAVGLRNNEGWVNIDLSIAPNHDRYRLHRIEPEPVGVPDGLLAEQQRLQGELEALEDTDDDWDDAREEAYNAIDARLDAIAAEIDGYRQFSDEDKARSVCFVNVGRDGKAEIHRGYVSPQAQAKAEKQQRKEAGEETAGLSQALIDDLGTHRQQIAKAKLARDPKLAMDVLLYSMASQLLTLGYMSRPIEASFSSVGPDLAGGSEHAETPAGAALLAIRERLSTDWLVIEDDAERFAAHRALPAKAKQALFSYCVSASFLCGAKREDGITEAVLADLDPDYAKHWRPTAANYFSRVPRDLLHQHGSQWFGEHWALEQAKAKKKDLAGKLAMFFANPVDPKASDEVKAIHASWLPEAFGK